MPVKIAAVPPRSLAALMGMRAGDTLLSINGEPVADSVDYHALDGRRFMRVKLERRGSTLNKRSINKGRRPLGLELERQTEPRACRNACVFCFVDQLPGGVRPTLKVKDDDWRASLTAGNFITLTNVDRQEFRRILRRRASPLFISVHAADGPVRAYMLRNKRAAGIMGRLRALRDAGLTYHAQIVLCPGYNDGAVLDNTIRALAALWPATQSVAVVPVGLTGHREGLTPLKPVTPAQARALINYVGCYQALFKRRLGTRLVYLADEFYVLAGQTPPPYAAYDGFPQLSNGVGLMRLFERQYLRARARWDKTAGARAHPNPARGCTSPTISTTDSARPDTLIITGASAAPWMQTLLGAHPIEGVTTRARVVPIANAFFGGGVTVAGLVTGRDILRQVGRNSAARALIPCSMLRAEGDAFLDGMSLKQVSIGLGMPVIPVDVDGNALLEALAGAPAEK